MPELPEVEATRTLLERCLTGHTVQEMHFLAPGVLRNARPEDWQTFLVGRSITNIGRRGKHLLWTVSEPESTKDDTEKEPGVQVVVHLKMTGHPRIEPLSESPSKYLCLELVFENGETLRYYDKWRWGEWWLFPEGDARQQLPALRGLGVEPLGDAFTPDYLAARLAARDQTLKAFLLDQSHIAGVGNIYCDESLHRAGLHPTRRTRSLTPKEGNALHAALVAVLTEAVSQGRTAAQYRANLDTYDDVYTPHVYGRSGEPCPTCSRVLEKMRLHGRGTTLCPNCQH